MIYKYMSHYIKKQNNRLFFGTNNSNSVTISNRGNVGIGITYPSNKLDVSGNINYTGNIYKNGLISNPMVLLETREITSSITNIDFPNILTTDYHIYKCYISNLTTTNDNINMYIFFSTDNGSSYITTGYYLRVGTQYITSRAAGNSNQIELTAYTKIDNGGTYNVSNGEFTIYEPTNSNVVTVVNATFHSIDDTNNIYDHYCYGYRRNRENNNAFRIRASSGNVLTAKISIYGLKQ
jgi:hypothetical protein